MIRFLFWSLLFLLLPGLLLRIDFGGAGILAVDILLSAFIATWLWVHVIRRKKIPRTSIFNGFMIFVCIAALSLVLGIGFDISGKEILLAAGYVVRLIGFALFGLTAYQMWQDDVQRKKFFRNMLWITLVVVLLGFVQFYVYPDLGDISNPGEWDPHVGRLLGTWMDPNYMAAFIGFMLCMTIGLWYENKNKWFRARVGVLFLGMLYALFLTFSRGGYLAAVAGLGVYFLFRDPKILLLLIAMMVLGISTNERAQERLGGLLSTTQAIILSDTSEIDPTANLRLISWRRSTTLFERNPIFGIGYNTYRTRASQSGLVDPKYFSSGGADSTHLTVLVTTGIVGFLPYVFFCFFFFWRPLQVFRKYKKESALGFAAGWMCLLVHATFVNSLFFPLLFLPVVAFYAAVLHQK